MRKRSVFTIPAAAAGIIALGLTVGALSPSYDDKGVGTPTHSASAPFTLPPVLAAAVTCQEDEPCFDCESMGNLICGGTELPEDLKRSAWKAWDAAGGAEQLLVNPHAMVTLTGYSTVDPYKQGLPELDIHQLALHESGIWYIFTATAL
jgi:hypothetical protein